VSDRLQFVPASDLYDPATGRRISHPATWATDREVGSDHAAGVPDSDDSAPGAWDLLDGAFDEETSWSGPLDNLHDVGPDTE